MVLMVELLVGLEHQGLKETQVNLDQLGLMAKEVFLDQRENEDRQV